MEASALNLVEARYTLSHAHEDIDEDYGMGIQYERSMGWIAQTVQRNGF